MHRVFAAIGLLIVLAFPAMAECTGDNLIARLPAGDQSALRAKAALSPYANGNFWRATRGAQVVHLIGTYHLGDPRHAATMAHLAPVLATATALLVEAGPAEQAALKARIGREPQLLINTTGPTLPEMLTKPEWARLSDALRARGIPPFMAAKFRPWYLSVMLSVPACDMAAVAAAQGLDDLLIAAARARDLPVMALEPYDTLFGIFAAMPLTEQLGMITSGLAMESRSGDFSITLADAYFAGEGRLIWEFLRRETLALPGYTPARVDREFASMEAAMMITRNRAWIPVIEAAATRGPTLVAFGALHLSGDQGVLALLAAQGFTLQPLTLP